MPCRTIDTTQGRTIIWLIIRIEAIAVGCLSLSRGHRMCFGQHSGNAPFLAAAAGWSAKRDRTQLSKLSVKTPQNHSIIPENYVKFCKDSRGIYDK